MTKPLIGIVSNRNYGQEDRPFTQVTSFTELIMEQVYNNGGIPAGVLFPYGIYDKEYLEEYDGFVFPGGSRIELCQLLALRQAILDRKPVLGICNGMQTMGCLEFYSSIFDVNDPDFEQKIASIFDYTGEDAYLKMVSDHNKENPFYMSSIDNTIDEVYLDQDSMISKMIGEDVISGASLHDWACRERSFRTNNLFKVVGRTSDRIIEVVESVDPNLFALGVQFHIELENDKYALFNRLVSESKLVKKIK